MPRIKILFYQETPRDVPALDWLRELRRIDQRGYAKCVARVQRLAEMGHELRRPEADLLRDAIYELRARRGHVHYRLLYFFPGLQAAVLACGLDKKARVPDAEIDRAVRKKRAFEKDPDRHTYEMDPGNDG